MARRLTDTEAMLWNLDETPSLRSTMGMIAILDSAPDPERLRNTIVRAIGHVPALRERVRPSTLPLFPPEWVLDSEFDLDHHLRFIRLPAPASRAAMIELAAAIINDPFDRGRPLWQITTITGLPRGRAGLAIKLHHSIADGQGALALGAHLLEFEPASPPPEPIALADVLAGLTPDPEPAPSSLADSIRDGAEKLAGFITGTATSFAHAGRAAEAGSDAVSEAVAAAKVVAEHVPAKGHEGSPLWRARTRNRRFVAYELPLENLRDGAQRSEVSLNDLFVVACAEAAVLQHERASVELPTIAATVVISTRHAAEGNPNNAFIPVGLSLPGTGATTADRLAAARHQILAKRDQIAGGPDVFGALGSFAAFLPNSMTSVLALDQARRVDFATSNVPGLPVPAWIAGQRIESMLPVGPVAGTAFNATLLSYGDLAAVGFHVDPAVIPDRPSLRSDFRNGLKSLGVLGLPR